MHGSTDCSIVRVWARGVRQYHASRSDYSGPLCCNSPADRGFYCLRTGNPATRDCRVLWSRCCSCDRTCRTGRCACIARQSGTRDDRSYVRAERCIGQNRRSRKRKRHPRSIFVNASEADDRRVSRVGCRRFGIHEQHAGRHGADSGRDDACARDEGCGISPADSFVIHGHPWRNLFTDRDIHEPVGRWGLPRSWSSAIRHFRDCAPRDNCRRGWCGFSCYRGAATSSSPPDGRIQSAEARSAPLARRDVYPRWIATARHCAYEDRGVQKWRQPGH